MSREEAVFIQGIQSTSHWEEKGVNEQKQVFWIRGFQEDGRAKVNTKSVPGRLMEQWRKVQLESSETGWKVGDKVQRDQTARILSDIGLLQ